MLLNYEYCKVYLYIPYYRDRLALEAAHDSDPWNKKILKRFMAKAQIS